MVGVDLIEVVTRADLESAISDIRLPGRSNVAPVLFIEWDPQTLGLSGGEVGRQLSQGTPRIEVFNVARGFSVMPCMM